MMPDLLENAGESERVRTKRKKEGGENERDYTILLTSNNLIEKSEDPVATRLPSGEN